MVYQITSAQLNEWQARQIAIANAVHSTFLDGGFSYWYDGIERVDGYSVGNNNDKPFEYAINDPDTLQSALQYEFECNDPEDREYDGIGTWINEDTGELHLDNIRHVVSLDDALALGIENGEHSIYDIANACCIEVVPNVSRTLEELC